MSSEDLLRPSLSENARIAAAPYSSQVGFLSAFFGGPFAAAMMIAVNAHRAGRLGRDWAWAAALAACFAAYLFSLRHADAGGAWLQQSLRWLGRDALDLLPRFFALLAFFFGAWLHRQEQRSADLLGLDRPNGWLAGVALIAAGWGLTRAVAWAIDAGAAIGH